MQDEVYKLLKEMKAKEVAEYNLTYDSPAETLEPIYYWLLDFMQDLGFDVEKIIDNFTASPGSGYFAELGKRATIMQQQAMDILAKINAVIKSIINLLYDLRQFEVRLQLYDKLKSDKKEEREAALAALKEIWITNVDIKKGRGAINILTTQLEFVTLRDAFFQAKSVKDIEKMDLNERVKAILKSRYIEFETWLKESERELRKRFEIEKTYLKSQVASLRLYTKWMMPYLRAAEQLYMKQSSSAALVSAFNTMLLELLLLGTKKVTKEELPASMQNQQARDFYICMFIDFSFRSIPRQISAQGHYGFGGRIDILFRAYVLRQDEYESFKKKLDKEFFDKALKVLQQLSEESLKQLHEDLEHFLGEGWSGEEKQKQQEKKQKTFSFKLPSFSFFKPKQTSNDTYTEKVLRALAEKTAAELCFKIYDVYKKAHGMPSYPAFEE